MVAFETIYLVYDCRLGHDGVFGLKLDMSKAYDRVMRYHWRHDKVEEIYRSMGSINFVLYLFYNLLCTY